MAGWQLRQLEVLCCRNMCKLPLPAFMPNTASTPIILCYVYVVKRFGRDQHKDRLHRTAEVDLLHCKFSGLCNACDCSGTTLSTCGELWDKFLQDTGRLIPSKAQMPAALDAWRVWGQHAGLSVQQQELCLGPKLSVRVFDRATVRNTRLACTRVEKSKFAHDSVVLTKSNGKYCAGWVNAFLSHVGRTAICLKRQMLPRWIGLQMQSQLQASAMVCQSAWAAQCSRGTFKMTVLAISGLNPCRLASVPHSSHSNDLVVLSRFASFMHQGLKVS